MDHGVDLHPIQNLDVDALLKLEVVEIGSYHGLRSRIPESRYYTISRTPTRGFAVGDRAFHDIIVYITGGTLHDEADEDKPDTLEKERDSPGIRRKASEISMMIFEAFFITVIAVLHALAWKSAAFPSNIERLLWQMSCIGMAGFPILIAIYTSNTTLSANIAKVLWHNHLAHYNCHQYYVQWTIYVYDVSEVIATGNYKDCETGKGKGKTDVEAREDCPRPKTPPHWLVIMHVIMAVVLMFLLVGYILCILYITVESYISLRRPPHDVFETPKWTDYWPHV